MGIILTVESMSSPLFKSRFGVWGREEIRFYLLETQLLEEGGTCQTEGGWGHPPPSPARVS